MDGAGESTRDMRMSAQANYLRYDVLPSITNKATHWGVKTSLSQHANEEAAGVLPALKAIGSDDGGSMGCMAQ